MLDLSKPEVERAYKLGIKAGELVAIKAAQEATMRERNRITRMLDLLARRAEKRRHTASALTYRELITAIEAEVNVFEKTMTVLDE
jgi:hypothetical protein